MDSGDWDSRYAASTELMWSAEPNRFVVDELAGLPAGRALDLAAGEGRNAIWLAQRGWRVTAVDFSAVAIGRGTELAVQRGIELTWTVADLRRYAPPPAAFDAVLVVYLHIPADDRATVLRRAADALAPGGTLLIVGHDRENLTRGVGGPQVPALLYTPEEIAAELGGLLVERAETARRPVSHEGRMVEALDTVVVARRSGRGD
jgi:SAM-dependent methyltransferase